jgi:hypothetical protein
MRIITRRDTGLLTQWTFGTGALDSDALAFITAAGITDATQQIAINTLVVELKGYGIWSKLLAIYPFVGGTATTHKFNLINPADTNAAFRLAFSGGWTHSNNGALPNGTNAYGDTFINASSLNLNSHSFGIYSRTNNTSSNQAYGVTDSLFASFIQNNISAGNFISGSGTTNLISYAANPTTSLLMGTRTSNTLFKAFRAGLIVGSNTNSISALPNFNIFLGARNNFLTPILFSVHELAFSFFGSGLTDTESVNLYTAVQNFNTTLNRQV